MNSVQYKLGHILISDLAVADLFIHSLSGIILATSLGHVIFCTKGALG